MIATISSVLLLYVYVNFAEPLISIRRYEPIEGDIVFQSSSESRLINMIKGTTNPQISHCGIVVKSRNKWKVLEAVGPVKETPLGEWVKHGQESRIAVYRLKEDYRRHIPSMIKSAYDYLGKPYDKRYRFDDEKIYCSELVFKAYLKAANDTLGIVRQVKELNWEPYRKSIEHYEGGTVPLERKLITPIDLANAKQLSLIYSNGLVGSRK